MIKAEIRRTQEGVQATLTGKIDEHFDAQELLAAATGAHQVALRLDGIRSITSLGVRAFEAFMHALGDREVLLDEISAAVANQVTLIPNLLGRAKVRTARLPFVCPSCGTEKLHSVPYVHGAGEAHAPTCGACQRKMDFDGFSEEYLPHS